MARAHGGISLSPDSQVWMSRSRSARAGSPSLVGEVMNRYLERSGLAPKVEAASVIPEWAERVGPQIASVTEPLRVSEGTLLVAVATSAWLMELNMMNGEILRRLNAGKKEGKIRQIIFVMKS
jgi:predicted nucleic acid-binding Zn ribbon protein